MKKRLMKYVEEQVRAEGDEGIELGLLGQKLYSEYPQFNAKEFGYATFAKFVLGIRALSIETSENNRVKVYLKEQTEKAEKPQKAGKTSKGRRGKKAQETE